MAARVYFERKLLSFCCSCGAQVTFCWPFELLVYVAFFLAQLYFGIFCVQICRRERPPLWADDALRVPRAKIHCRLRLKETRSSI